MAMEPGSRSALSAPFDGDRRLISAITDNPGACRARRNPRVGVGCAFAAAANSARLRGSLAASARCASTIRSRYVAARSALLVTRTTVPLRGSRTLERIVQDMSPAIGVFRIARAKKRVSGRHWRFDSRLAPQLHRLNQTRLNEVPPAWGHSVQRWRDVVQ
jgi:hypothetical protein